MKGKAYETFLERINKLQTIEVVGEYINHYTRIGLHCCKCNKDLYPTPKRVYTWTMCPNCIAIQQGFNHRVSENEFLDRLQTQKPFVRLVGEYKMMTEPTEFHCDLCDNDFRCTPDHLIHLHGEGCIRCSRRIASKKRTKSHDDFVSELKNVNPNINVRGQYVNSKERMLCECLVCGNVWNGIPHHLIEGIGCPECYESHGERKIRDFLNANNILYQKAKKFDDLLGVFGKKLSYDFFIPSRNILIEFQGKQHCEPIEYFGGQAQFEIQQEHDKRKLEYALQHNITLITIWYWEEDKICDILSDRLNDHSYNYIPVTTTASTVTC